MNIIETIVGKIIPSANASNAGHAARPSPLIPEGAEDAGGGSSVDVSEVLSGLAQKRTDQLNWRSSIVDLLKLLDLDSSLAARKALAKELNFTGDMKDTPAMNVWLHQQVMRKLQDNGGSVPDDLRH